MATSPKTTYIRVLRNGSSTLDRMVVNDSRRRIRMDHTDSDLLASTRQDTLRIRAFLNNQQQGLEPHLNLGRSIIRRLDAFRVFQQPDNTGERIWVIDTLQRLAYFDPDSGGLHDIAVWCVNQWLQILQQEPDNAGALQGLGHAWLYRAQRSLARIHHNEGSSSSGDSGGFVDHHPRYTSRDEARDAVRETREADARLHSADYVEARGILLPSSEYFGRAVASAERTHTVTGQLLALAAESYMSLGNVSHSSINETYFRQALVYLRRASQIPGYTLSPYLQHQPFNHLFAHKFIYFHPAKMLEARLEQASLLKKVVDAIKDLVLDCNFDCNDSGIALQAMDNSHVALVSMMLKAEGFSPFRCDRNIALGINLTSLTKVLRAAQNEDILTLKAEDAPDVVNLVFESSETERISEYDIKLMDIDQEHLGIPDTEYAATIEMPSAEFQRICRDLNAMSESVSIEASKEGVRFSCQGDIGNGSVTVRSHTNVDKPEQDVTINLSEPVSLTFSLKYLVNFCKASGLSPKVKLCLSQEVPLLVEYTLGGSGWLRFYLAPKIGDDE